MNTQSTTEIKIASYSFTCPVTGQKIRKGDNYIEQDGVALSCKAGLPARKLRLIGKHTK